MKLQRSLLSINLLIILVALASCNILNGNRKEKRESFNYTNVFFKKKDAILAQQKYNFLQPTKYLISYDCLTTPPFAYEDSLRKVQKKLIDSLTKMNIRHKFYNCGWGKDDQTGKILNNTQDKKLAYHQCDSLETLYYIIEETNKDYSTFLKDSLNYIPTNYTGSSDITQYDTKMLNIISDRQEEEGKRFLEYLKTFGNWTRR